MVVGRMAAVTAYFLHMLVWALPYEVHLAVEYDHNERGGLNTLTLKVLAAVNWWTCRWRSWSLEIVTWYEWTCRLAWLKWLAWLLEPVT